MLAAETIMGLLGIALLSFCLSLIGSSVGFMLGQIRLPFLVLWLGSPALGAGTNLAISSVGALSAFIQHLRQKTVDMGIVALMGIPSGVASFFVGRAITRLPGRWLYFLIGVTLLYSALEFLRKPAETSKEQTPFSGTNLLKEVVIGGLLGAISGCVGLMMGTLRLSSLINIFHLNPKVAVGTNLGVGFVTGIFGAIGIATSLHIHWTLFAVAGTATGLGSFFGAQVCALIPTFRMKPLLAIAITLSGLVMLVQAIVG